MSAVQLAAAINTLGVVCGAAYERYNNNSASAYGRYSNAKQAEGKNKFQFRADQPIHAKLAWFLMEVPNLLISCVIMSFAPQQSNWLGWYVCALFVVHYAIRTLVYSVLLTNGSKPMPLNICVLGAIFTSINGAVQTYYHLFEFSDDDALLRVVVGSLVFFTGFAINQHSDRVLRNLRRGNGEDTGYYIPQGFFFDMVSAPNLLGEIIEWMGYAAVSGSFVATCFAVSTLAIIGNRAVEHHRWYLRKFENYPKQRRALVPGVY